MCIYYELEFQCGHGKLYAGPSCYRISQQLQRINNPYDFARPGIPFQIPENCLPNKLLNIQRRRTDQCCGSWECTNNAPYADTRCGEWNAAYGQGSERIGVGWRY